MNRPTSTVAGSARGRLEVGPEVVGADEEVGGVGLGAVAVVGHGEDLTGPAAVDDRREALDRLRRERERDPVGRRGQGARGRSLGEGVDRQHGPADESRLVTCRVRGWLLAAGEGGDRRQRRQSGERHEVSDEDGFASHVSVRSVSVGLSSRADRQPGVAGPPPGDRAGPGVPHASGRSPDRDLRTMTGRSGRGSGHDRDSGTIRPGPRPAYDRMSDRRNADGAVRPRVEDVAHRSQSRLGGVLASPSSPSRPAGSCCSGSGWTTRVAEPAGQNWWFVTWFCVGLAYSVVGAALVARSSRRRLGTYFLVVGGSAVVTAISTRVPPLRLDRGSCDARSRRAPKRRCGCARSVEAVLVALVTWELLPQAWRADRRSRYAFRLAVVGIVLVMAARLTSAWEPGSAPTRSP